MDSNTKPTHRFTHPAFTGRLAAMEGTIINDPWDGPMFMPHTRYHEDLEAKGYDLTGGLFIGGVDGGDVTPL